MDTQETRFFITIILTCTLFGVFIVYFFLSIVRQQRRSIRLQKENILAEIRTLEKERARMAKDLHDDLGPVLSVIKFQIDNVESIDPDDREQLQLASTQIDGLIDKVREIANNLLPSVLLRKGLVAAIEEYAGKVESSSPLKIHFTHSGSLPATHEKNVNIFRIVQEVVHNAVKHSRASQVNLKLEGSAELVTLLYQDNGRGFNYQQVIRESGGFGLKNLQSRARILGGSMEVDTKPNQGTVYFFEIPV